MCAEGSKVHGPPIPNKSSNEQSSLHVLDMISNGRNTITNVTSLLALQTIPVALAKATGTRKLQRAPPHRLFQSNGTRSCCCDRRATKHEWSATKKTRPTPLLEEPTATPLDFRFLFLATSATEWRCSDCCTSPARCRTQKIRLPYIFHSKGRLV